MRILHYFVFSNFRTAELILLQQQREHCKITMSSRRSRRDYRHDDPSAGHPPDSSNRRSQYDDHSKLTEKINNSRRSRSNYRDDDLSAGYRPDSSNRGSYNDDHSRLHETALSNTDRQRSNQSNNWCRFDDTRSQGSSQKTSHRHDSHGSSQKNATPSR